MANPPRRTGSAISEENTLAILDSSGVNKDAQDMNDDRLSFLEAVRASSIVSDLGAIPSRKMLEAVFQILRECTSLELIMASYQLLNDVEKCFPRADVVIAKRSDSSSNTNNELNVLKEAWSPFLVGSDCEREVTERNPSNAVDSAGFFDLTQDIANAFKKMDSRRVEIKTLGNMLLFQYLLNVLEGDFLPRYALYKETMDWILMRESLLHMLLGSRRINYKSLIRGCVSILFERSHHNTGFTLCDLQNAENASSETLHDCDVALTNALIELGGGICVAVQKFLTLIMEYDMVKKQAAAKGFTSRADGLRTPLVEIILEEITYDKSLLPQFLEVFSEPRWKFEIALQYFWKYCTKSSIHTRRSSSSSDDKTFENVLKCFSNGTSTRNIVRILGIEEGQLILAHAFQAYLCLQGSKHVASCENLGSNSLVHICKNMISAFGNLKRTEEDMEILPFAKEALFTAATILSTKS